jgi:hypothetical protein
MHQLGRTIGKLLELVAVLIQELEGIRPADPHEWNALGLPVCAPWSLHRIVPLYFSPAGMAPVMKCVTLVTSAPRAASFSP